jgi:hypothetical protein
MYPYRVKDVNNGTRTSQRAELLRRKTSRPPTVWLRPGSLFNHSHEAVAVVAHKQNRNQNRRAPLSMEERG